MAVSRKTESVQLANTDEVRANLPFSGARLVDMGYGMQKAIDVGYVMVGKRTTTLRAASADELTGKCAGATHFVRGAYGGAFAVSTGTLGQTRSAVNLLGAGVSAESVSAKQVDRRDGDPAACKSASLDAVRPPDECTSLLRLELVSLSPGLNAHTPASVATMDLPAKQCPMGWSWWRASVLPTGRGNLTNANARILPIARHSAPPNMREAAQTLGICT